MWFLGCPFLPWVVRILTFQRESFDGDLILSKKPFLPYIIEEAFSTTKWVELVGKKEFAAAALDPEHETFVVYVVSLESPSSTQKVMSILLVKHR